jgi:hypothetical protein
MAIVHDRVDDDDYRGRSGGEIGRRIVAAGLFGVGGWRIVLAAVAQREDEGRGGRVVERRGILRCLQVDCRATGYG